MPAIEELPSLDDGRSRWRDALLAAQLFAIDPAGLGGIAVASGPGPVRDLWLDALRTTLPPKTPVRRLPAGIEDDRLLGGVDLAATLRTGRPVLQNGILAEADGGIVLIPMAERLSAAAAARIAGTLDNRAVVIEREGMARRVPTAIGVVAFDEGASDDERLPVALLDRFAFHIDLDSLSARGLDQAAVDQGTTAAARKLLPEVEPASDPIVEALVTTAASFGIASVTAPLLALRTARVLAALSGRTRILEEDAVLAARLVLGPRARTLPEIDDDSGQDDAPDEQASSEASPSPQDEGETSEPQDEGEPSPEQPSLEDIMLAAVQTALPESLLAQIGAVSPSRGPAIRRQGGGAAQAALRGRPAGVWMGAIRPGSRLALVETLRAAAPWQPVRRAEASARPKRIDVRREDFRIKKFVQRRESTIVFCVDASGSTAFHRLAEAKGAVELLLAEAYIARTHAALIAFRGNGAELLLPPTRSLSRAKALLATLPGGGGTPLASGIDAAVLTALGEKARGREPLIVLLTDGRANIGRDGVAARPRAGVEALDAAQQLRAQRLTAVFVDTAPYPRGEAASLATVMDARYVALPFVEASAVRDVVLDAAPELGRGARRG